jgi:hypothetical protein
MANTVDDLIKRVGLFKRKRPQNDAQARRFFYCERAKPGERCLISGDSCGRRHLEAKHKIGIMERAGADYMDVTLSGHRACGDCGLGEIRVNLLKLKRRK